MTPPRGTVLETERLRLREFRPSDLAPLFELYRDPEIRRHFPDGMRTYEQTREELEWFSRGEPLSLVARDDRSDKYRVVLGSASCEHTSNHHGGPCLDPAGNGSADP